MSHDAQHAKEVAKAELLKLEHQLMEEKKQREKELADRRALVQQKVGMVPINHGRPCRTLDLAFLSRGWRWAREWTRRGEMEREKSLNPKTRSPRWR